jgi:hypothetical protein
MADLVWTTEVNTPAQIKKELLHEITLSAGEKLEAKTGDDDFDESVPVGKEWAVIISIRVTETDV